MFKKLKHGNKYLNNMGDIMKRSNLNLADVKNNVKNLKGESVWLAINRGRKKIEKVSATIKDIYPSVFTITTNGSLQTFSYFDIMCGNVKFLQP